MNRVRVTRTITYQLVCGDCGRTLAGPYDSYDEARVRIPEFQQCNHPTREDQQH